MTKFDPAEAARLRAAFALRVAPARSDDAHPDADRYWDAVRGELDPSEIAALVEHAIVCPACADVWRLAREVSQASDLGTGDTRLPAAAAWRRPRVLMSLAASLVIAVGLGALWQARRADRAPAGTDTPRAASMLPAISAASPRGEISAAPARFEWSAIDGAERFRVDVRRDDGALVWTSVETAGTAVERPADLALPAGVYFWEVTGLRGGAVVAQSPLTRFVIRP